MKLSKQRIMKKYTKEELKEILRLHKLLLDGDSSGVKADLRYADLRYADLSNSNLRDADLSNANLINANLSNSNLSNANLINADLRYANLINADLSNSNLRDADLSNANLRYADLRDADLSNANLRYANLINANLRNSDLRYARMPMYSKWDISIVNNDNIQVGCKIKTVEEWKVWLDSDEEFETKRGTDEFMRIESHLRAHITYCEVLHENGITN